MLEVQTKCFYCFYYHKGLCRAKNTYVKPNSLCVFYMENWAKVRGDK